MLGHDGDSSVVPKLQVRPRHALARVTDEEKIQERDRLAQRILERPVAFKDTGTDLTDQGKQVLRNVAEAILDYPELPVSIQGHVSTTEKFMKSSQASQLCLDRTTKCAQELKQLGVMSELLVDTTQSTTQACCTLRLTTSTLLEPQERINLILQRHSFDFVPRQPELSNKGNLLVRTLSRILLEANSGAVLYIPRASSDLAIHRADIVAEALKGAGAPRLVPVRRVTHNNLLRALLTLDESTHFAGAVEQLGGSPEVWDPQSKLEDILQKHPLAFQQNSSELVPSVIPTIREIGGVLKQVQGMVCMVEAFSGFRRPGQNLQKVRATMQDRAQRIVDGLLTEGVKLDCRARGYSGAYCHMGQPHSGPCIVLTLVNPGDEGDAMFDEDQMGGHRRDCWTGRRTTER